MTVCPKCGYERTRRDSAPEWQCPRCHVAYNKVAPRPDWEPPVLDDPPPLGPPRGYRRLQRALTLALVLATAAAAFGWQRKGTVSPIPQPDPDLLAEPRQNALNEPPLQFDYAGRRYEVQPVADYDLRGVIVTHNDIGAFWDIYHDESSVDTRDICVVWGDNVRSEDLRSVEFWSTAWTCHFEYPYGAQFDAHRLSNNHLITDDAQVRRRIARLRIGDEIRLRGKLVNYRETGSPYWRKTSTRRTDTGANACEVVFVDQIDIITSHNAQWHDLFTMAQRGVLAILAAKLLLLGLVLMRPLDSHRRARTGTRYHDGAQ